MALPEGKTRVQITLGDELLAKMDEFCAQSGLSRSAYIATLVSNDLWAKTSVMDAAKQILQVQMSKAE